MSKNISATTEFVDHAQQEEFIAFGHKLADTARSYLQPQGIVYGFETKADNSPVTEFDRGLEKRLRELILARFPEHGIIGEEFPPHDPESEFVWVMDPIDGTKQFVAGIPVFTTLISLCMNGVPVLGMIDAPATGQRWVGVQGGTAELNGAEIHTSGQTQLQQAKFSLSQPDKVLPRHRLGFEKISKAAAFDVFGAAAYGFGLLAAGTIDICVYSGGFGVYDVCALAPIVQAAGGLITDESGQPVTLESIDSCIASATPELHEKVLETLMQQA